MKSPKSMVPAVQDYLDVRRSLGFSLSKQGTQLLHFGRYVDLSDRPGHVTAEIAIRWALSSPKDSPMSQARRLGIVRRFARHQAVFDPETEIPPGGLLEARYRRKCPHIYSEQEIADLMRAASELIPRGSLRPHTYVTLLSLLAATGLRIGEALRLKQEEADLRSGLLTIRGTKFRKSRLVPLHPSTVEALKAYRQRRNGCHPSPEMPWFFLTHHRVPITYEAARRTFVTIRNGLGWSRCESGRFPRLHDLRHTFAVRTLLGWYRQGEDIDRKIAVLATYLGHVNVEYTYWYLTAVPELLAIAGSRFETFASDGKGGAL